MNDKKWEDGEREKLTDLAFEDLKPWRPRSVIGSFHQTQGAPALRLQATLGGVTIGVEYSATPSPETAKVTLDLGPLGEEHAGAIAKHFSEQASTRWRGDPRQPLRLVELERPEAVALLTHLGRLLKSRQR